MPQAGAGDPSVTVSSWPTVSRPNNSGMKAPIVTTAKYRAEKYRRGAGVRCHQEGRQHSGKDPPGRLAKGMSAPAQRSRELLGEVGPEGGRGRQRGEAGQQRARD